MLVCIAADAFLYLAVRGMAQRSALKAKNDLLSAQIDRQKEHYAALTAQYANIRRMRHDIAKHLDTMQALLRFTNIGLYSQAVGINASAARLNGIHPQFVKFLTYVILGLCVAVAGFIKVSRFSTINYSVVAKDIEMDAILAVALGGNALSGGKFNIWASVLGAYVIQFLTTTLFKFNVVSSALPAYKAVVVIILVVLSAPTVREKLEALKKRRGAKEKKEAGIHAE